MNNYEYIIASLPVISQSSHGSAPDAEALIAEIRSQLTGRDDRLVDMLLNGFDPQMLTPEFYTAALKSGCGFLKSYFAYDLDMRNAKVRYLNRALERPEDQDVMVLPGTDEDYEFEDLAKANAVLEGDNILDRERGLDDMMWEKIDSLTYMDVLNLNVILGFIAKLKIVDRWNKLDPKTGEQMFRKLVESIRATYDNKKQNLI